MEVIPTQKTDKDVIDFLMRYGDIYLGKTPVLCKDTPAFIANRIGVFSIMAVFKLMKDLGLKIKEIDTLTGPLTGKPKSATFRTADVVGIDTLVKVSNNVYKDCPDDEARELFKIPDYVDKLVSNNWLGDKTGQGFYKKSKDKEGKKEILELNIETFEYEPSPKVKYASVTAAKQLDNLKERVKALTFSKDKAGEFLKKLSFMIFQYSSNRVPEIADEVYKIDDALRAGFGWELGPFETWDALGLEKSVTAMEEANLKPAKWIYGMLAKGFTSFYKIENGSRQYYDINSASYKNILSKSEFIILDNYRANKPVWKNVGATLHDIGDGVLNLEFQTKMNSIGSEILEAINKSIEITEKDFKGLVIGNDGPNFSAGANLAMMFMLATEQEYDEIDLAVRMFQKSTMRIRYSAVPVVSAPHGMTLGGGGTKEMTLRASDQYQEGLVELPILQEKFLNIAMAKVATSAQKAFGLGIFKNGRDNYVINQNRVILEAKKAVLELSNKGYTQPEERNDIKVLGRSALSTLLLGAYSFYNAKYISQHDKKIAEKLAYIMCGGDLTAPSLVSEQYLLDLEREAFLSLIGEKKTMERIQSILTTGKPLRN